MTQLRRKQTSGRYRLKVDYGLSLPKMYNFGGVMNWDAIGAIGETIGAAAVVVSLLYLAVQIRAQNKQSRLSALHEMSRILRDVTAIFATEDMTDIFVRANQSYDSITDAESVRLIVLVTNFFRAWEDAFLENRDGHLDGSVWEALSRDYTQSMGISSFRHIWNLRKQNYDDRFREYVDSLKPQDYSLR
jgi:hypothetical protein